MWPLNRYLMLSEQLKSINALVKAGMIFGTRHRAMVGSTKGRPPEVAAAPFATTPVTSPHGYFFHRPPGSSGLWVADNGPQICQVARRRVAIRQFAHGELIFLGSPGRS
jgi:hypothetical protein